MSIRIPSLPASCNPVLPFASVPDARPTTSSSTATDVDDWSTFFNMPFTPPVSTPDGIFAGTWSTPLDLSAPVMSHDSSSPTDFAFELPSDNNKTPSTGFAYTPNTGSAYNHALSGYSSASSFSSSASGSYGGASFSSTDALPAISRDFSRPNAQQAKRPATAGGVLQSRAPFGNLRGPEKDIMEEPNFMNPFGSSGAGPSYSDTVDPRHAPASRRASEGQGSAMPPPNWPIQGNGPTASTPSNSAYEVYQHMPQGYRPAYSGSSARPQTSDGLPSFGGPTPLPSARSVVGSLPSLDNLTSLTSLTTNQPASLQPAAHIRSSYEDATMPFRPRSEPRTAMPSSGSSSTVNLDFVPINGPAPKKRPRRRFDEIERLYKCGWSGCEKSYGTLNHLNAHVSMQQHGEKRLPSEFKDMRKAWRKKKRENTAASANNPNGQWARGSVSSESDYDRRTSSASAISASSSSGRFPSTAPGYKYESRPTTSSSVASSADGRQYYPQANVPPFGYGQGAPSQVPSTLQSRRDSAPQHVSMPFQGQSMGFRQNDDGVTPTPQNPFPFNFSMNYSMGPAAVEHQQYQQQQQYAQQQQHAQQQQQQQPMRPGTGGFPFQALTQPMPLVNGPQYGQFAFQR